MNLLFNLSKSYSKIKLNNFRINNINYPYKNSIRNYYCLRWVKEQEEKKNYKNLNFNQNKMYEELQEIKKQNEKILFLLEKNNLNKNISYQCKKQK